MAIARGAGTEIIRSAMFEECDSTIQMLIVGVQHHIYTILSVIMNCRSAATDNNFFIGEFVGYDSKAGTTARTIELFRWDMSNEETFVWNDKCSFNGAEPANFSGPMDDATKQDAIADQGSTPVVQIFQCRTENASDNVDGFITYIDQNSA